MKFNGAKAGANIASFFGNIKFFALNLLIFGQKKRDVLHIPFFLISIRFMPG